MKGKHFKNRPYTTLILKNQVFLIFNTFFEPNFVSKYFSPRLGISYYIESSQF